MLDTAVDREEKRVGNQYNTTKRVAAQAVGPGVHAECSFKFSSAFRGAKYSKSHDGLLCGSPKFEKS